MRAGWKAAEGKWRVAVREVSTNQPKGCAEDIEVKHFPRVWCRFCFSIQVLLLTNKKAPICHVFSFSRAFNNLLGTLSHSGSPSTSANRRPRLARVPIGKLAVEYLVATLLKGHKKSR